VDEQQASVIVKVKESSTKAGPPAVEVMATDQATDTGRQTAVVQAVEAYRETKELLKRL